MKNIITLIDTGTKYNDMYINNICLENITSWKIEQKEYGNCTFSFSFSENQSEDFENELELDMVQIILKRKE